MELSSGTFRIQIDVLAQAQARFKEGNERREIETRPTLVVVKEQGKWHVVAFQNTKVPKCQLQPRLRPVLQLRMETSL
jgi:hypothetical protein